MAGQPQSSSSWNVVDDNLQLVHLSEQGVTTDYFAVLQTQTGLSKATLARYLGIDPTTVDNYRRKRKKFTGDTAEKLLTLHRLFARGEELFGSVDAFLDWLALPSPGLEGERPQALLHSVTGIGEVDRQLQRISYGYVA